MVDGRWLAAAVHDITRRGGPGVTNAWPARFYRRPRLLVGARQQRARAGTGNAGELDMEPITARSLRRRQPGQGSCGCCFLFGLGLLSLPFVVIGAVGWVSGTARGLHARREANA